MEIWEVEEVDQTKHLMLNVDKEVFALMSLEKAHHVSIVATRIIKERDHSFACSVKQTPASSQKNLSIPNIPHKFDL